MNNHEIISWMMDLSDCADRLKKEVRGMRAAGRILSSEEYHAMKDLLLGMVDDVEIAESDLQEYQRLGFVAESFAAKIN